MPSTLSKLFSHSPRARRVGELLLIICFLSAVDLGFTLWAYSFTPFEELNPFARQLLDAHQISALVLAKAAFTAFGAAIFWHLRRYRRAEAALWLIAAAYVMLTVRWSNYTQIIALLSPVMS